MVMKYLDMKKIPYTTVSLDDDMELRQEVINKSGAMTVPVTVRGDWEDFVVGWQVGKLAKLIS